MSRARFLCYLALFTLLFIGVNLSRRTEATNQLYKLSVYLHEHMGKFESTYGTATS